MPAAHAAAEAAATDSAHDDVTADISGDSAAVVTRPHAHFRTAHLRAGAERDAGPSSTAGST